MWYGVLGPLLVRDGDSVIGIPASRQRVLLAALLMRVGMVIPADVLVDVMWDGSPSAGAATTLRSHVARLRRTLGSGPDARVITRHSGYLIEAEADEVDFVQFGRLCQEGMAALRAGGPDRAAGLLDQALSMWRGDPLADVPSARLHRDEVPAWEQMRLHALEARAEARMELGRHGELMAELRSLSAGHPLHERFHALLMLALYRSGRQAEALAAYHHACAVLAEELGADPGSGLRRLHQQILTGDPRLSACPPAAVRDHSAAPRQLPLGAGHFTGRTAELGQLNGWLEETGPEPAGPPVIGIITGTPGVGKTALAVHWAHQVAGRYPDGQLHVNLRGYDNERPRAVAGVLAGFLRALGVPGQDIPVDEDECASRYRSLLAGQRVLIILDNAGSVDQVRPLLPGTPGCAVLITSRDALTGLVAREGAIRLNLDQLPPADAIVLLRALIGPRIDAEPGAARSLADRCSRLPLALRVAAELATTHPERSLAELAGELTGWQQRLDLLDAGGDLATAIRSVFTWSYQYLDADSARTFRLLGLNPVPDCDLHACVALTGGDPGHVRRVLDRLARAHLIQLDRAERISLHDLLYAYARELALAQHTEAERSAELGRLLGHQLNTAARAMDMLYPAERHRRPAVPAAGPAGPPVAEAATARAWLDAQRGNLITTAQFAAGHGWPGHAVSLAVIMHRYLDKGGHYAEAIGLHGCARHAAQVTGDIAGAATVITNLGTVHGHQGQYSEAADCFRQALALHQDSGDRTGLARALSNLGIVLFYLGRSQQAGRYLGQALALHQQAGDRPGEACVLGNLGLNELRLGHYPQAQRYLFRARSLYSELGNISGEAHVLSNIGDVSRRQGRLTQASRCLRRALTLSLQVGNRAEQARVLTDLGLTELREGAGTEAVAHLREAVELSRQVGERSAEAAALNALGEALLAEGCCDEARGNLTDALALAALIHEPYEQARAHDGLARTYDAAGEPDRARHHWHEAFSGYSSLGAAETERARDELAAASHRCGSGSMPPPGHVTKDIIPPRPAAL